MWETVIPCKISFNFTNQIKKLLVLLVLVLVVSLRGSVVLGFFSQANMTCRVGIIPLPGSLQFHTSLRWFHRDYHVDDQDNRQLFAKKTNLAGFDPATIRLKA